MCRSALLSLVLLGGMLPAQPDHLFFYVDDDATGPGTGTLQDPFPTIQDAFNVAVPHDYVLVQPGTYTEFLDMPGFIYLRSVEGPEQTVIDATGLNGTHAVVVSTLSEVSGFTIKKADGGGVLVASATAEFGRVVRRNRILGCPDGGIEVQGPVHPLVSENVVAGCGTFGVRFQDGPEPFFTDNTVTGCPVGLEITGTPPGPQASFANSILWGNGTDVAGLTPSDVLSSCVGDPAFAGVNGSVSADPLWRDAQADDYRLLPGSPCLEAADPNFVPFSTSFDNRGFGAWRRMDADHDGQAAPDIGAFERGGLDVWQTGTGAGSTLHLEIDTGPNTQWFLGGGPFAGNPVSPFPTAGSTHTFLYLEPATVQLLTFGAQGAAGITTLTLPITSPAFVGLSLPVQAVGVDSASVHDLTNAQRVTIR